MGSTCRRVAFKQDSSFTSPAGSLTVEHLPSTKRQRSAATESFSNATTESGSTPESEYLSVPSRLCSAVSAGLAASAAISYLAYVWGILPRPYDGTIAIPSKAESSNDLLNDLRQFSPAKEGIRLVVGDRIMGSLPPGHIYRRGSFFATPPRSSDGEEVDDAAGRCASDFSRILRDLMTLCRAASAQEARIRSISIVPSCGKVFRLDFEGEWERAVEECDELKIRSALGGKVTRSLINIASVLNEDMTRVRRASVWILIGRGDWKKLQNLHNRSEALPEMIIRRIPPRNIAIVQLKSNDAERKKHVLTENDDEGIWMVFRSKLRKY